MPSWSGKREGGARRPGEAGKPIGQEFRGLEILAQNGRFKCPQRVIFARLTFMLANTQAHDAITQNLRGVLQIASDGVVGKRVDEFAQTASACQAGAELT